MDDQTKRILDLKTIIAALDVVQRVAERRQEYSLAHRLLGSIQEAKFELAEAEKAVDRAGETS